MSPRRFIPLFSVHLQPGFKPKSARPFVHSSSRPSSVLRSAYGEFISIHLSTTHPFVHLFCKLFVHSLLNHLYLFSILMITYMQGIVGPMSLLTFVPYKNRTIFLISLLMAQVQASGIWRKWKRKFRPGNPEGSPLHTSNSGIPISECICCLNGFLSHNTVEDG